MPLLTRNRLHYQPPCFGPKRVTPEIVYDFSVPPHLEPEHQPSLATLLTSYTLLILAFLRGILSRLTLTVFGELRLRPSSLDREVVETSQKIEVVEDISDEPQSPLEEKKPGGLPRSSEGHNSFQDQKSPQNLDGTLVQSAQTQSENILPSDLSIISVSNGPNIYESILQIDSDDEIEGEGQYGTNLTITNHSNHMFRDWQFSNTSAMLHSVFEPNDVSDILKPLDDYDVAISKFYTPFRPVPLPKYTVTDAVLSAIPSSFRTSFLKKERDHIQELVSKERSASRSAVVPLNREQLLVVEKFWRAGRSSQPVVSAFSIDITCKDLLTLADGQWLNDNVIDFYLNLVTELQERVYCWTTHFYTTLKKNGYKGVARWAKRRKINVVDMKTVIVPINSMNTHWAVAVVDNEQHTISYYDSLGSNGNRAAVELLEHYMQQEAERLGVPVHQYRLSPNMKTPQQQNGYDCGVFTCTVAKFIALSSPLLFSQKDMPVIRRRMAFEIVQKNLLADSRAHL